MYVLKNRQQGKYVSKPNHVFSYTDNIGNAKKFLSIEAAVADSCIDSEYPVSIYDELGVYNDL